MVEITLKGSKIKLASGFPHSGDLLPDFELVAQDLSNVNLDKFKGKRKLIATVPSLDTDVCSLETKKLQVFAKEHPEYLFLLVSADLPFAQKRFCKDHTINNIVFLSSMRNQNFAESYGVLIETGPLAGIMARSIIVANEKDRVVYSELVSEITIEPNYDLAFSALQKG